MGNFRSIFPSLFSTNARPGKPTSVGYRQFSEKWGLQKIAYAISGESLVEAQKVQEMFATTVLQYLTYLKDKSIADEEEDKFQEQLRKARR